jgi:predicted metal-dependent HD superfamily phosphohydrolase
MRTSPDHWLPIAQRTGVVGDAAGWHARLVKAYGEPQRAYHTLQHLDECLGVFDEAKGFMQKPDLIEMALWFHDAVYDPKSGENEALSAEWAIEALGGTVTAREVARQIMLTKSHQPGEGSDDAWIIDIDLAIFAQSPERVLEYERQIREEYAWVPHAVYRDKRMEILRGFLKREQIYRTAWARTRFEELARENLQALIVILESSFRLAIQANMADETNLA